MDEKETRSNLAYARFNQTKTFYVVQRFAHKKNGRAVTEYLAGDGITWLESTHTVCCNKVDGLNFYMTKEKANRLADKYNDDL